MSVRTLFYLYQLRRNLRLNYSELQEMQRKRLKLILKHAYENVPLYHRKFKAVGVKPEDVRSIDDLSKLPITTKHEIQSAPLKDITAKNINLNKCVKRTTSGSTGIPLTIFVDSAASYLESAIWARAFFENDLRFYDKMAVVADPRSFPKRKSVYQHLRVMDRQYISIFDDVNKQLALLKDYKPQAIKGYPSSLVMLAEALDRDGYGFKPRLVFTSAELLDNAGRKRINSSWQTDVLDNYACNELSLLAWECQEHMGYHTNIDGTVMEFIDDGEPVASGERGKIVCTSLFNMAMPFIRYEIGDVGVPTDEQCLCGRTLPLMKIVEGRTDDFLVTTKGRVVSPTIFFPYPFANFEGIKQFRVIQRKRNEITIQIAANENFTNSAHVLEKAQKKIRRVFGEDMEVNFQILDAIPKDHNGKLRKVISLCNNTSQLGNSHISQKEELHCID